MTNIFGAGTAPAAGAPPGFGGGAAGFPCERAPVLAIVNTIRANAPVAIE
jgi:hypothetical protein